MSIGKESNPNIVEKVRATFPRENLIAIDSMMFGMDLIEEVEKYQSSGNTFTVSELYSFLFDYEETHKPQYQYDLVQVGTFLQIALKTNEKVAGEQAPSRKKAIGRALEVMRRSGADF